MKASSRCTKFVPNLYQKRVETLGILRKAREPMNALRVTTYAEYGQILCRM